MRVFLVHVVVLKVGLGEFLDEVLCSGGELGLGEVGVEDESSIPRLAEHPVGEVHANGSDETGLCAQEPVIEQGGLDEELGERSGLEVVVVGLADSSNPRVWRAVGRDVEVERLRERSKQKSQRERFRNLLRRKDAPGG